MNSAQTRRIQQNIIFLEISVDPKIHLYLPYIKIIVDDYLSDSVSAQRTSAYIKAILPSMEVDTVPSIVNLTRQIVSFLEEDV